MDEPHYLKQPTKCDKLNTNDKAITTWW